MAQTQTQNRKILITGSRDITDEQIVYDILTTIFQPGDIIITGGANGVDQAAIKTAESHHLKHITIRPTQPQEKISYLFRNAEMIGMCDMVIAIWNGQSRGTKFTIEYAQKRGKPTEIFEIPTNIQKEVRIQ